VIFCQTTRLAPLTNLLSPPPPALHDIIYLTLLGVIYNTLLQQTNTKCSAQYDCDFPREQLRQHEEPGVSGRVPQCLQRSKSGRQQEESAVEIRVQ
jgi:hypothetical protein